MNKKQTAVEWLDEELWKVRLKFRGGDITFPEYALAASHLIQEAKAMERQQQFEFWNGGINSTEDGGKSFDQYFTETYGE